LLRCLQTCFFYVDKSNAFDVEKVKTEPEEVEDKEFKEDKKALVPSRFALFIQCFIVLLKLIIFKGNIYIASSELRKYTETVIQILVKSIIVISAED
jgi:hypothetical protein